MSPSPFLSPFIMNWLAAQTVGRVQQEVVDELKRRVDDDNLGDYDGILFKDSIKSKKSVQNVDDKSADVGVVGALKQELVGIFDKMGVPKATSGNSLKYYTGTWRGLKIAVVETGVGAENARRGTEALIQAFQPSRVVSAGFAAGLVPTLKSGALVVPNRLVLEDGRSLDLSRRLLANEEKKNDESSPDVADKSASGSAFQANESLAAPPTFAPSFLDRFATGALLTVDRIVSKPSEKKRLAEETGATILDMETWAVAEVCAARNVPFLPLRVVFDVRDETTSREVQNVVESTQSAARMLGALFGAVSKRPSAALDLYKLKERSLEAADKLASALDAIFKVF